MCEHMFAGPMLASTELVFRFNDVGLLAKNMGLVLVGAVLAFFLEFSEFLLVSNTSSLTLSIAGIFKVMHLGHHVLCVYISHSLCEHLFKHMHMYMDMQASTPMHTTPPLHPAAPPPPTHTHTHTHYLDILCISFHHSRRYKIVKQLIWKMLTWKEVNFQSRI